MTLRLTTIKPLITALLISFGVTFGAHSAPSDKKLLRIGYIGCLTGLAAEYGNAALEGAQLAAEELTAAGTPVKLLVEDDQSNMKGTVQAYAKLSKGDAIDALVTGSWWVNAIVKIVEKDRIPFLSAETVLDQDTILAGNYFILGGDLRSWVRVYEPLVKRNGWKRGATVRFSSGFGATIASEMKELFSRDGRSYAGTIEYGTIDLSDAAEIALKLKKLAPEVVYVDAQPGGLAVLVRRMHEIGLDETVVIANSIAKVMVDQKLADPLHLKTLYYSLRENSRADFIERFEAKFHRAPKLNADLAYYAVKLAAAALATAAPVAALKEGITVDGRNFNFDRQNIYTGLTQEIWMVRDGRVSSAIE